MSLSQTRFGADVTPLPAVLPSLTSALSRRAALFGAVTAAGFATEACPPAKGFAAPIVTAAPDVDRRLTALAADLCSTLDGAAYAFDRVTDEDEQDRRLDRANALQLEIAALPAVGLPGVLAKAKAYLDSNSYDVVNLAELADSLAEDVERVLLKGALS